MPNPARESFTYIDYSRPIRGEGIEKFLAEVDAVGRDVFGIEGKSIITEPITVDDLESLTEDELRYADSKIRTVGPSRLTVYDVDSLEISLLHRRVPRAANLGGSFNNAANRMARATFDEGDQLAPNAKRRPRTDQTGLQKQMGRIGMRFGFPDQDNTPINFTAVTANPDPNLNNHGLELALIPDPASEVIRMLARQSETCFDLLAVLSQKSAYPSPRSTPLNLPFARLPHDYNEEEATEFFKAINERFPVRGIMGAVRQRPTVHS